MDTTSLFPINSSAPCDPIRSPMKFSTTPPNSSRLNPKPLAGPLLGGTFFKFLPVFVLGTAGLGWVIMVRAALSDPGFAIEPDYYKRASNIDQDKLRQMASARLGWKVQIESLGIRTDSQAELKVSLRDRDGEPLPDLQVSAVAFFNGRANELHTVFLPSAGKGLYVGRIEHARPGLWEIRLSAKGIQGELQQTFRNDLLPSKGPS